jgi:hypothetical protein
MRTLAISVGLLAAHCSGSSGPPPSGAIATSAASVEPTATQVTCTGPSEEVTALGSLCGFAAAPGLDSAVRWAWRDPDMAIALGGASGPSLLLYADVPCCEDDQNVASKARMAVFVALHPGSASVDDWHAAEAVTGGSVSIVTAVPDPCSGRFTGSATLQWRATTIRATWVAQPPGC